MALSTADCADRIAAGRLGLLPVCAGLLLILAVHLNSVGLIVCRTLISIPRYSMRDLRLMPVAPYTTEQLTLIGFESGLRGLHAAQPCGAGPALYLSKTGGAVLDMPVKLDRSGRAIGHRISRADGHQTRDAITAPRSATAARDCTRRAKGVLCDFASCLFSALRSPPASGAG
jgi:hypothetical protein